MTNWKLKASEHWQFLIVYVSSFRCQVYAVMETTSNPWSVAKPETFQSLSLTTGLDYRLFNSPSALSVWWSRPLGHSNHSEHPERLPSRRVLKALWENAVLVWGNVVFPFVHWHHIDVTTHIIPDDSSVDCCSAYTGLIRVYSGADYSGYVRILF